MVAGVEPKSRTTLWVSYLMAVTVISAKPHLDYVAFSRPQVESTTMIKLLIIAALACAVTWLATGSYLPSLAQNQSRIVAQSQSKSPQYNIADYVGSEAPTIATKISSRIFRIPRTRGSRCLPLGKDV